LKLDSQKSFERDLAEFKNSINSKFDIQLDLKNSINSKLDAQKSELMEFKNQTNNKLES
jgi:hypothetical protein